MEEYAELNKVQDKDEQEVGAEDFYKINFFDIFRQTLTLIYAILQRKRGNRYGK